MEHRRQPSLTPDLKMAYKSFLFNSGSSSPVNYHLGLEKLQVAHQNKQLAEEIGLVSNKINAILKFEAKTKEKLQKAKMQAEETLEKKARNELKVKEKELWVESKKKEVEELKRRNCSEKEKRKLAIKALQTSIVRERQEFALEVKKNRLELDSIGKSYKQMLKQQKAQMKTNRIKEVIKHKAKSDTVCMKWTESLKQAYEDKIAFEKRKYLELLNKKKELEKQEAQVIENYSKTLNSAGLPVPELNTLL